MVVEKLRKLGKTMAGRIDRALSPRPEDYEVQPDAYMAELLPRESAAVDSIALFFREMQTDFPGGISVLGGTKYIERVDLYVAGGQTSLTLEQRDVIKESLNTHLQAGEWEPVMRDETIDIVPSTSFRSMSDWSFYEPIIIRRRYPSVYVPTDKNTGVYITITDMNAEHWKNRLAGNATRFAVLV